MAITKKAFQAKLPARIAGLVFWSLVLVGLLTAVLALKDAAPNLTIENKNNVRILANEIEEVLEQRYVLPVNETSSGRIRHAVNNLRDRLGFGS